MTDWNNGFPPPPFTQPPPPSGGPVTPEQLKAIGLQLVIELQRLNVLLPPLAGAVAELNARLASGSAVDPQVTKLQGVVGGIQDVLSGLGIGIDPPGRAPPKRGRR